jgi:hypothetical protein
MLGAPRDLFMRTTEAVHLAAALGAAEREVWRKDWPMLVPRGLTSACENISSPPRPHGQGLPISLMRLHPTQTLA